MPTRVSEWPARYPGRALRNAFLDEWRGREDELERNREAKESFRRAAASGDLSVVPVWASEAIDLITDTVSAADLVGLLAEGAEHALSRIRRS